MLKYLSIIALGASCITLTASAQGFTPGRFAFDYDAFSQGQVSPIGNSLTLQAHNLDSEHPVSTIDVTITWTNAAINNYGAQMVDFSADSGVASTVTFSFGNYTVSGIVLNVYGLNGQSAKTGNPQPQWGDEGGKLKIEGISKDTNIRDNFKDGDLTASSGYGEYQRQHGHRMNSNLMISTTITQPLTQLELYFQSMGYQIGGLSFTATGYSPVPEPATYAAILGLGVAGIAILRRRPKA